MPFLVPGSRFRVLALGSVLGSMFVVPASGIAARVNVESNQDRQPATRNPEAGTERSAAWCPMHPNVRGAAGERCRDCGMSLVEIPDRTDASYWLDAEADPVAIPVGRPVRLRLTVRDRATDEAVSALETIHERLVHLFVVSHDLSYFDHVHPGAAKEGAFDVAVTLPRAGAYRLVADVLPIGAAPQMLQHTIVTAGAAAPLTPSSPEPKAEILEMVRDGLRARLVPKDARAGGDAHLTLEIADEETGAPVTDLEPYLGAWGHMLLAHTSLGDIAHSHPYLEETTPGGPRVTFQTLFARPGWYRVWTQVQRAGRVLTFAFTLRVAPVV
jgi:hypothetical protein